MVSERSCNTSVNLYPTTWRHIPEESSFHNHRCEVLKYSGKKKLKLSLWQAAEAHTVVRRRGSQHFLDNRLTDGGEVGSLTHRPPLTPPPGRLLVLISVKRQSRLLGHSAAGRIRSIEKSSDLIGNRSRHLTASSIVTQPTALPRAPRIKRNVIKGTFQNVNEYRTFA
jgi:hypothetical protein